MGANDARRDAFRDGSGRGHPNQARLRHERGPKREKAAADRGFSMLDPLKEFGAGEAIRTLDPNLGKVVLYP
jgi:hypothetical protein